MESKRRRGRSFLDEDDDNSNNILENNNNNNNSSSSSSTSHSNHNSNSHHHSGHTLEPYNPNIIFEEDNTNYDENNNENKSNEDEEEDEDEQFYTRTRTRSRSVHENDDKVKILSEKEIQAQVAKSREHPPERQKVEKTGPLQHREVAALQQGLQEATNQKREAERLEEQAELEAALREKEQRSLSSSVGHHLPTIGVQIGSDPPMRRVKILLLGDSNVGKTSIISRLTTGDFRIRMVQTVGVDYKVKKVNLDGENIQVQLWDTAGSERFHQITTSYYRGVNGIMLCFDVSSRESYERVAYWLQNIKKYASENVHVMLVGNKIDLRVEKNDPNSVYEREVKPIANKYGISYAETSALTSDNVEGALLSLVRDIVQGDTESTTSGIRKSVDSFMKRASSTSTNSKSNNGSFGSGSGSGEKEKDKEKCTVS